MPPGRLANDEVNRARFALIRSCRRNDPGDEQTADRFPRTRITSVTGHPAFTIPERGSGAGNRPPAPTSEPPRCASPCSRSRRAAVVRRPRRQRGDRPPHGLVADHDAGRRSAASRPSDAGCRAGSSRRLGVWDAAEATAVLPFAAPAGTAASAAARAVAVITDRAPVRTRMRVVDMKSLSPRRNPVVRIQHVVAR